MSEKLDALIKKSGMSEEEIADLFTNIPAIPAVTYEEQGWVSLSDYIGKDISLTIWTFKTALAEAKTYKNRTAFKEKSRGAYDWLMGQGYEKELAKIFPKKLSYWTIERSLKEARKKKYKSRKDFMVNCWGAFNCIKRLGHVDELNVIFPSKRTEWTLKTALKEAKKYKIRKDFELKGKGAYAWLRKKGYLGKLATIFPLKYLPLTLKSAIKEAKSYKDRKSLKKKCPRVYLWFLKNKKLDELLKIFPCRHWDVKSSLEAAKKCKSISDFKKRFSRAHAILRLSHLKELRKIFL